MRTPAEALFDFYCARGETKIEPGVGKPALIIDAAKLFGVPTAVQVRPDGRQLATLRVAAPGGGFVVPAITATSGGQPLAPGDLVMWVPETWVDDAAKVVGDPRSGWVGLIRAKVDAERSLDGGWLLACRYG